MNTNNIKNLGITPILDKTAELTENDLKVIHLFIEGTPRRTAYRQIYNQQRISDGTIYNWWRLEKVQNYMQVYQKSLDDYNLVCDKVLIDIITSDEAKDKDKIAAVKLMGDLRNRIKTTIKVEQENLVNFENISDEDLEKIILLTQNGKK